MAENTVTDWTERTHAQLDARAEVIYRTEMERRGVPAHLIEGLVRYLVHHIRPGHFLCAILSSDLREALCRADPETQRGLGALILFLFQVAPAGTWGNPAIVEAWLSERPKSRDGHLGAVVENSFHGGER